MSEDSLKIIETTIEYQGCPVKIRNGKVFIYQFGTTIYNHSMHYSLIELPRDKWSDDFRLFMRKHKFIK
jgi:hypothetical protein